MKAFSLQFYYPLRHSPVFLQYYACKISLLIRPGETTYDFKKNWSATSWLVIHYTYGGRWVCYYCGVGFTFCFGSRSSQSSLQLCDAKNHCQTLKWELSSQPLSKDMFILEGVLSFRSYTPKQVSFFNFDILLFESLSLLYSFFYILLVWLCSRDCSFWRSLNFFGVIPSWPKSRGRIKAAS